MADKPLSVRTLEKLLTVLRAAGVTSYQAGDVKIEFAPMFAAPPPGAFIDDAQDSAGEEQQLPPGLIDPRKALDAAYAKLRRVPTPSAPEGDA